MEKKNNNAVIWVVIGVLVVLVLALVGLVLFLVFGVKTQKDDGTGNAGPFVIADDTDTQQPESENEEDDIFEEEVTEESLEAMELEMIIGGYRFVSSGYNCLYADGIGPVLYMDDIFQMKIQVVDMSYEEALKDPAKLTEKTVAAGGTILQDVTEVELNGKKYAYFVMELYDQKNIVIHSQAPKADQRIAGQLVMQSDTVTNEDMLNVFDSVVSTAEITDRPDSTYDDIMEQIYATNKGDRKSESSLTYEGKTVTYQVEEGFLSSDSSVDENYWAVESFVHEDIDWYLDCYLKETDEGCPNAEAYIQLNYDWLLGEVKDKAEIKTMEVGGYTFYYLDVHYEMDGSDYQELFVACDFGDGHIYSIEVSGTDVEEELSIDTVKKFMEIK